MQEEGTRLAAGVDLDVDARLAALVVRLAQQRRSFLWLLLGAHLLPVGRT